MSKTTRLIKIFTELAEELDMELGQDNHSIWLYVDHRVIVNADFNEKGPTEVYVYSWLRNYEGYENIPVVRKSEIRKIAKTLMEDLPR